MIALLSNFSRENVSFSPAIAAMDAESRIMYSREISHASAFVRTSNNGRMGKARADTRAITTKRRFPFGITSLLPGGLGSRQDRDVNHRYTYGVAMVELASP